MRNTLANLSIRSSLLGVLGFFSLLLVIGAVLGVFSLHLGNETTASLKRTEDIDDAMSRVVNHTKDAIIALNRGAIAHYGVTVQALAAAQAAQVAQTKTAIDAANTSLAALAAQASAPVAEGATAAPIPAPAPLAVPAAVAAQMPSGIAGQAASMAQRAQDSLGRAQAEFERYQAMPKTEAAQAALNEFEQAYRALTQQGIAPVVALLQKGDLTGYSRQIESAMDAPEARFQRSVDAFATWRATQLDEAYNMAQTRYHYILGAVALGAFVAAVLVFMTYLFLRGRVLRPLKEAGIQFDRIAAGDLATRVEMRGNNEIGQLFAALKRMQESLTRTVSTVRRGVDEINVGSREISAGNTDLSSRTEQQAASLEETAASMEQLASTVKQNADNARQANQLAASASQVAERGGSAVSEVVNTMEGISASSRKISEIVSVIDGIAFQTNILALNAAVEAARAGEQGKGFAVVAGEVRSLAQRSAQAAKEIKVLIEDSVSKVDTGSQQVERAGATMQEIVSSVKRVTDIMGEISAASEEQSGGIDQVNRAVSQMDEVTQQNAALVEEAAAAAGSLQEQAQRLAEAVAIFRINTGEVIDAPSPQLQGRGRPELMQGEGTPGFALAGS
ncbi:methyl-accepting chemotaxis protein [Bordetella ansorpii]|nr:methyl-accepting chemotaxis protein [Bordetella ansorpii]